MLIKKSNLLFKIIGITGFEYISTFNFVVVVFREVVVIEDEENRHFSKEIFEPKNTAKQKKKFRNA
jgi:hypothetical protein